MKRGLLVFGLICTLAALAILSSQKNLDPRPKKGRLKAKPNLHRWIEWPIFSPNGEKLFFQVADESGAFSLNDTYIYILGDKNLRKLPISEEIWGGPRVWAPDSNHIAYNMPGGSEIFNIETNSIEKELNNLIFFGWSPDGKKQVFRNRFNGDTYIRGVDDENWTVLPREMGRWKVYYWTHDSASLISFNKDMRAIIQYCRKTADIKNLAFLKDFHNDFYTLLTPSRYSPFVYFTSPRPFTDSLRTTVLQRLNIRTGKVKKLFEINAGPHGMQIVRIYPTLNDDFVYFLQYYYDTGKKRIYHILIKLNTRTGEIKKLHEGGMYFYDYSERKDIFSVVSEDRKNLYLFDAKTRVLEQIYPPEETT
jgi:hypothetical protein